MKSKFFILMNFFILLSKLKWNILFWIFSKKGQLFDVNIGGEIIKIRKGTTDFRVALATQKEFEILKYALPTEFSGVIIDAGGYIGTAAIALSKLYPNASIISIEPSQENFNILELNCKSFNNITPLNNALSSKSNETITLNDRGTGNWGFTIVPNPEDKRPTPISSVQTITIQDIEEQFGETDLIKLDIEGAEKNLFEEDEKINEIKIVMAELHERIAPGCDQAFFDFSKNRVVIKDQGEKYISIKQL